MLTVQHGLCLLCTFTVNVARLPSDHSGWTQCLSDHLPDRVSGPGSEQHDWRCSLLPRISAGERLLDTRKGIGSILAASFGRIASLFQYQKQINTFDRTCSM